MRWTTELEKQERGINNTDISSQKTYNVTYLSDQNEDSVKHDTHGSSQDVEVRDWVLNCVSNTDPQENSSHSDTDYEMHDFDDVKSTTESDLHSIRSVSTTSTIPPEVIRSRVKAALEKRGKAATRQRCLAKGEASAVTRKRRENRETIKECNGIWGYE